MAGRHFLFSEVKSINKNYIVNEDIRDKEIRVIASDGSQLGILPEASINNENIDITNTTLTWSISGHKNGMQIKTYYSSQFVEFNSEATVSLNSIVGIALIYDLFHQLIDFDLPGNRFINQRGFILFEGLDLIF